MIDKVMRYARIPGSTALIVASVLLVSLPVRTWAADPPPNLLNKIAERETASAAARENYTYRQSVTIQEFDHRDLVSGQYHEVRDVTFSPSGGRYEQVVEKPQSTLTQIKLTPEDFADIRNIQPFFLTDESVHWYSGQYKGEEAMDGVPCFVETIRPKQILSGQRFFEGTLWVRQSDFSVVRSEGRAVPQIETLRQQNLFPHFTTIRRVVDGAYLFPVETYADDTLFFKDWPQRVKVIIRYSNYKRFGADSTLTYGTTESAAPAANPATPPPNPQVQ